MSDLSPHFDVEFRVRYAETDQMGVVYHAEYLVWCEVGRTEYIRSLGLPYAEMERRGAFLAVADASLRYHASARYDDLVRVETRLSEVRSRAITFDYLIRHVQSGARLVSARTMLVSLDRDGRPAPLPADVRDLLERALHERAMHERAMHERAMHERAMHERAMHEPATPEPATPERAARGPV